MVQMCLSDFLLYVVKSVSKIIPETMNSVAVKANVVLGIHAQQHATVRVNGGKMGHTIVLNQSISTSGTKNILVLLSKPIVYLPVARV